MRRNRNTKAGRFKKTLLMAAFALAVFGGAQSVSAQNMSQTVVEKRVKFARGQNKAVLRGSAKYGMSYVYKLRARAGQTMEINLAGKNPELSFSLIAPDEETIEDAFGVTEWSGKLPQTGDYSIVVVINDEDAAAAAFTLEVEIR